MTLENWYFIAEIGAAIAFIASLSFFIIELRRNLSQSKKQATDLIAIQRADMLKAMYEEGELASIIWRGFSNEPRLPAHEWARFSIYLYRCFVFIELTHKKHIQGEYSKSDWSAAVDSVRWWLRHPGVRAWWNMNTPGYTQAFIEFVNDELKQIDEDRAAIDLVGAAFANAIGVSSQNTPDKLIQSNTETSAD